MKTVPYTVCRPVQETGYKNCTYTVCRPGPEDLLPVGPVHGQVPVQQTVMQCQPYTADGPGPAVRLQAGGVHGLPPGPRDGDAGPAATPSSRPVRRTVMRTCTYTVCRPVQRDGHEGVPLHGLPARCRRPAIQTVTETCYQTVTETACREVCETVCVPRTVVKQVSRECGEWVDPADLRPGQDDLRATAAGYQCPRHLLLQAGLVPADGRRERLRARSTSAQVVRKQVPYTDLQAGARTASPSRSP